MTITSTNRENSSPPMITRHNKALLYTLNEAADLLSVSRSTIYRLMNDGSLRSVKIYGSRRIPHNAINAYCNLLLEAA